MVVALRGVFSISLECGEHRRFRFLSFGRTEQRSEIEKQNEICCLNQAAHRNGVGLERSERMSHGGINPLVLASRFGHAGFAPIVSGRWGGLHP
jgi:hypothetical protein